MLKFITKNIVFYTVLLISTNTFALEFQGKFIQGHFIIGKTEPESKIWIDKKKVKVQITVTLSSVLEGIESTT